jgi:DtxR family transcriptional regulator, Mn-dependent transcriptional regulator
VQTGLNYSNIRVSVLYMMTLPQTLTTTMEDYLEAIAWLIEEKGVARVRDIAASLSVHKSTVTAALKSLAEKGLVNYSAYEAATLTADGGEIAQDVIRRHKIVREFFIEVLSIEHDIADANACRIEHVLDAEVLERLASFAEFVKNCPASREGCLKQFQVFFNDYKKRKTKKNNRSICENKK